MHMATKPQTDSVTGERVRWEHELMDKYVPLIWTRGSWMLIPMERGGEVLERTEDRERLKGCS
jgi:hypothetical protein